MQKAISILFLFVATWCFAAERSATVLLVTDDSLKEAWQPFADWKTRLGKRTKIVTVDHIRKHYEGDDVQQKIRACCLDFIETRSTRWIVLGGDSQPGGKGLVPDRDTHHLKNRPSYADIPTDLYYLSPKTWDADGDGVYGDWTADREEVAYTHERASIGRIPVRTAADVKAYTDKVIAYESAHPENHFGRVLTYTCPEGGAYPKLATSAKTLETHWEGGRIRPYFSKPGAMPLTPGNWVELINARATGKMHMHGHGFLPVWILEGGAKVDAGHVARLKNRNAYLAMTTVSCFTGHYDAEKDPSITESMLRAPDAGAVLVVAPSREGIPAFHNPREDFRLMVREGKMDGTTETMTLFWKYALTENLTAGEALRAAKAELADDAMKTQSYHFIQCELNLLGDPTLDLRAKDPVTPRFDLPETVKIGKHAFALATGAPGATVCFWKGGEVYEVVTADERGKANVDVDTKTPGELLVTVSGASLNAATGSVKIR